MGISYQFVVPQHTFRTTTLFKMKVAIAFLALASAVAFADNCLTGHTWPQGQQGNVQVTVPADTKKWRIALTFDTPPNRIHAAQGKNERCSPRKKMCFFNSEKYNMKATAGEVLDIPYEILFDESSEAPKVTEVKFMYCDARPCGKWNEPDETIKEVIVATECTEAPTTEPPTEATTEETEEEDNEEEGSGETSVEEEEQCGVVESHAWNTGATGKLRIPLSENTELWEVTITFDKPIDSLEAYQGVDEMCDGETCTFTNESWNGELQSGNVVELTYQATFEDMGFDAPENFPKPVSFTFNGEDVCA